MVVKALIWRLPEMVAAVVAAAADCWVVLGAQVLF
jgi:hypothetical protein